MPSGPLFYTADDKPITTWGFRRLPVHFGCHRFHFPFLLAAVSTPIIGHDFLSAQLLLVDPSHHQLLHNSTFQVIAAAANSPSPSTAASLSHIPPSVQQLLNSFPTLLGTDLHSHKPTHGETIETTTCPIAAHACCLDPEKHRIAQQKFLQLEKQGIIHHSNSPWSSPLHMVPKKNCSWRPCGLHSFFHPRLSQRLPPGSVAPSDIPKTAIVTPFGLFEYLYMPFGLHNAAQTFQCLMDRLFAHLPNIFVYLVDILLPTADMHLQLLDQVLTILRQNNLLLNPEKSSFAQPTATYLGHTISAPGLLPLNSQITAIQDYPTPTTVKQLQRFLGLINFYRRFLPHAGAILRPLTDSLKGNPKTLHWTPALDTAFVAAKQLLLSVTPLQFPDPTAAIAIAIATDASDSQAGAVLQQSPPSGCKPLAFFSTKLIPAQQKYSTFDHELLAPYLTIRHFRFLLKGCLFQLHTDHQPHAAAMHRILPPCSARQQRQLAYIY
jgi:hypothetical protein